MVIKDPPVELTDRLFMLGTREYPLYLFRGGREGAIFEGGVGAMGALLFQQMERLGIGKNLIRQVVISHAHPDHVMAVPLFRRMFPGISVAASAAAAKTLSSAKAISFFRKIDETLTDSLMRARRIGEAHRPPALAEDMIPVDRILKEGDAITVDGSSFAVLETPGHSDCSLSFFEPTNRVLLVSDATGYPIPERGYWWPNYFTGFDAYLRSMERLAGMGAEVLCLSHNGAIKGARDVREYFEGALAATKGYHRRIVDAVKAGTPARELSNELGAEVHRETQLLPLDFFQKSCGVLVKESLRHEGMSVDP